MILRRVTEFILPVSPRKFHQKSSGVHGEATPHTGSRIKSGMTQSGIENKLGDSELGNNK